MNAKIRIMAATAVALLTALSLPLTAGASIVQAAGTQTAVHVDGRKVIVVKTRPPARRIEVRTSRPSTRHVWIDGHWGYRQGRFVWVRGHWAVRPHVRAVYVRPQWTRRGDGWVFVRGYWRH